MTDAAQPVVSIEDASFSYNGASVVTGVTLDVMPGEAVALIGPNGAGKSTLLAGLLGEIRHRATRFEVPQGRGAIGILPQHRNIDPDFPVTLRQVVMMGRLSKRSILWPSRADRDAVAAALEAVDLADLANRPFGELSGGQQQRGLLARALAGGPRLLLMDEPFNGLDTASRERLLAIVERLKTEGVAVIITTHDFNLARAVTERTLLLNREQIAFDTTECVLTLEYVQETFEDHAVEIDGHTLATAERHNLEHHHAPPASDT